MRLRLLDDGHAPAEREGLREWEELAGTVSDVTLALAYRPDFFGDPVNAWIQDVLRGQSEWGVGECELIGAFTATSTDAVSVPAPTAPSPRSRLAMRASPQRSTIHPGRHSTIAYGRR